MDVAGPTAAPYAVLKSVSMGKPAETFAFYIFIPVAALCWHVEAAFSSLNGHFLNINTVFIF